jgi:hypothetical protein
MAGSGLEPSLADNCHQALDLMEHTVDMIGRALGPEPPPTFVYDSGEFADLIAGPPVRAVEHTCGDPRCTVGHKPPDGPWWCQQCGDTGPCRVQAPSEDDDAAAE